MIRKTLKITGTTVLTSMTLAAGCWCYYIPDLIHERSSIQDRVKFMQETQIESKEDPKEPISFKASRFTAILATSLVSALFWSLGNLKVHNKEALHKHIEQRKPNQALITVANHTSCVDDPFLIAMLAPLSCWINQKKMRWSVCTQDICYSHPFVAGMSYAGKVLPISRGHGILQEYMTTACQKIANGDWVHIFPQGRIFQDKNIHDVKWGVGRLASYGKEHPPIIVPFIHKGMENVMKQSKSTNEIEFILPIPGKKVEVLFGDPINIDDLWQNFQIAISANQCNDIRNVDYESIKIHSEAEANSIIASKEEKSPIKEWPFLEKDLTREEIVLKHQNYLENDILSVAEKEFYVRVTQRVHDSLTYLQDNFDELCEETS